MPAGHGPAYTLRFIFFVGLVEVQDSEVEVFPMAADAGLSLEEAGSAVHDLQFAVLNGHHPGKPGYPMLLPDRRPA